jgi:hypothetical protein
LLSIGLKQHENSPCLFYGTLIPGQPLLYLGLYVDDFIYYSASSEVEKKSETDFQSKLDMELNGKVSHFLGINFKTKTHNDCHMSILLSQEAFIDTLTTIAGLDGKGVTEPHTPYRSSQAKGGVRLGNGWSESQSNGWAREKCRQIQGSIQEFQKRAN